MSRSKKKNSWSKRSTLTSVVLGLVASIPMNLLSAWLQEKVVINLLYLAVAILLVGVIIYSGKKLRTPDFLNNIFWLLLATVSVNLISIWIQYSLLHDTYSFPSVTLFLAASVIILVIGALFQSHYYRRFKQRVIMKRKWSARNVRLAKERSENPELYVEVKKRMPRKKRRA